MQNNVHSMRVKKQKEINQTKTKKKGDPATQVAAHWEQKT